MKLRPLLLLGAMALTLGVGACGKRGTLERPPPLWGAKDKADPDDGAEKAKNAQVQPSGLEKPRVPETRNVPIQPDRVETGKPDPVGVPPLEPHS